MAVRPTDSQHFRLFDLPPELRISIYEFALVISDEDDPLEPTRRAEDTEGCRQLLATSRRLREEAFPVYWKGNHFEIDGEIIAQYWLASVGSNALKCIAHLNIEREVRWEQDRSSFAAIELTRTADGEDTGKVQLTLISEPVNGTACTCECAGMTARQADWIRKAKQISMILESYQEVEIMIAEDFGRVCLQHQPEDEDPWA